MQLSPTCWQELASHESPSLSIQAALKTAPPPHPPPTSLFQLSRRALSPSGTQRNGSHEKAEVRSRRVLPQSRSRLQERQSPLGPARQGPAFADDAGRKGRTDDRSEEHRSELQSLRHLVCR